MSRISTLSSNSQLVKLLQQSQERLHIKQVQLATEKKTQIYTGIAKDTERLVNIENTREILDNFNSTNSLMDMRLSITGTVLTGIDDALNEFRKDLITFQATSKTDVLDVRDVQNSAFSALQTMEAYLNTDVNGEFIFAGGRVTTQPVDFGLTNLSALQTKWDGANITYPTRRDMDIHHKMTASTGFPSNPTGAGYTSLAFTAGAGGTITTSNLATQVDTITIAGTIEAGDTYSATVNGTKVTYTVTGAEGSLAAVATAFAAAINADATVGAAITAAGVGSTVTLTSDTAGTAFTATTAAGNNGATADNTATLANTTANANAFSNIPVGAKITISGADDTTNNGTFTVASNSAGVIQVSSSDTLALDAADVNATIVSDISYYNGDEETQTHNVNKTRSFDIDLTAVDPAFEKAIRGLFIIAQGAFQTGGGLDQNTGRVADALYLIDSALDRNPGGTAPYGTELTSSLEQVSQDIGYDRVLIDQTTSINNSLIAFYDTKISEFEDVDPAEIYTKLVDEQTALEASYQAMARIRQLSLSNFL